MPYETLPKRLERWAEQRVPGLRTYLKREHLRDSDKLIRDELAQRTDRIKGVLDKAKSARVDAGSLKNLDKLDRATRKVEKVRDTIKFDSRGYRGIFDPEEVAERELHMLLDFDEKLFTRIEEVEAEAEKVGGLDDVQINDALRDLEARLDELYDLLGEREKFSVETLPAGP